MATLATNISLCNIYAPNDLQQQLAFLRNLNNFLTTNVDIANLIVGGDWNVTMEAVEKKRWVPVETHLIPQSTHFHDERIFTD